MPMKGYIAFGRACAGSVETPFQYMPCPILIHPQYCAAPRAINWIGNENGVRVVRQVMGICEIVKECRRIVRCAIKPYLERVV